jgi:DNA polymerase-1
VTQPLNLTKTCLVLDCFALAYRAYYGLPSSIRTRSGQAINAVLGFYNTIFSLIEQFRPDYTVVASDDPEPTFRHNLYSEYKAQRPPMPEDLKSQLPLIREVIAGLELPLLQVPGYEADDVIGTIAKNLPPATHCYVVTTDRDTLQLASETVTIVTPNSKANKVYTPEIVEYEWGVPPKRIPDLKALMGDRSDNIPGVPLVGPKTAVRWLTAYGSLENLLSKAHRIKGKAAQNLAAYEEEALLYKHLATINCSVPTVVCWRQARLDFEPAALRQTLDSLGIRAAVPQVG